jgi:hypothetical protein
MIQIPNNNNNENDDDKDYSILSLDVSSKQKQQYLQFMYIYNTHSTPIKLKWLRFSGFSSRAAISDCGGAGGGCIKLDANEIELHAGCQVIANGENGRIGGGGGSGGSIVVDCNVLKLKLAAPKRKPSKNFSIPAVFKFVGGRSTMSNILLSDYNETLNMFNDKNKNSDNDVKNEENGQNEDTEEEYVSDFLSAFSGHGSSGQMVIYHNKVQYLNHDATNDDANTNMNVLDDAIMFRKICNPKPIIFQ